MAKSSRADTERHRQAIIDVASRLLRERGESAISVQAIMSEVGLTHGGFYKHFSSKDELMNLAAAEAFSALIETMSSVLARSTSRPAAWSELVDTYLSAAHREDRAGGCANTGLATDSARAGDGTGMRKAYVHGVAETLDALVPYQDPADPSDSQQARLHMLIILVGALTLSRATAGTDLSDEIAVAARSLLLPAPR